MDCSVGSLEAARGLLTSEYDLSIAYMGPCNDQEVQIDSALILHLTRYDESAISPF